MHAEIVSIGTEILMGEIVDTNSAYMASELAKLGVELRWVSKVGGDPERLFDVIDRAWRRSDITITSGGLGPTSDDLTRETIAKVMGEEMEVQDDLLEQLKSMFAGRGSSMPSTNIKQATLIPSAETIPNPMGTAPGWWVEKEGHIIISTPGPPRELERMWSYEIAPKIKERNPDVAIVTRTLKTFGISEGGLDEMLSPLFKNVNPELGIYSKQDGIHLRAIATASTEEEAQELIVPMEAEIRRIVGDDAIWGEDDETPEAQVAAYLQEQGQTLGIMESFTGGLLASNLADIPGSHEFLRGSIVILGDGMLENHGIEPAAIEEFGAVSAQVAEAMAEAARRHFNSDIGISITRVVTNPTPSSGPMGSCYIGFALDNRTSSTPGRYPTQQLRMRGRGVTHALLELIRLTKGTDSPQRRLWRR